MSTTPRIGAYSANFQPDNTGRTINQEYFGLTATSGTVAIAPTKQYCYVQFTNALTGNLTLYVSTASTVTPMVCDKLNVIATGGASTYSVILSSGITSSSVSVSVGINKQFNYDGTYNGANYNGPSTVA